MLLPCFVLHRVPRVAAFKLFKLLQQLLQLRAYLEAALGAAGQSGRAEDTLCFSPGSFGGGWRDVLWKRAPLFGGAVLELLSISGVKLPERASAWLTLLPGHLDEALVDAEVVPDGALDAKDNKPQG